VRTKPTIAFGQEVSVSGIQILSAATVFANEGMRLKPHLVKKILDRDGKTIKEFLPELLKNIDLKPEYYRLVKEGLWAVVNEPRGTGAAARLYEVKVAGKTGTSQVVKLGEKKSALAYKYRDHALFVAFAPYDKPEIAVAVVVEHGEHGGGAAAPVAGQVLRKYFELQGVIKRPVAAGDAAEDTGEGTTDTDTAGGDE